MTTFQELGVSFPLFAAPMDEASDYVGEVDCNLCHSHKPHGFRLSIGDDLILPCGACGTLNVLDADDMEDVECRECEAVVAFPVPEDGDYVHCCTDCLQAGKAAFTHDTQFGMVRWEDAERGMTHGIPMQPPADYAFTPNNDDWYQVHFSVADLLELVRTPNFSSWQGAQWQFCHHKPMIYLGSWRKKEFNEAAPNGDGQRLFLETVEDVNAEVWGYLKSPDFCTYVFRCQECGKLRGYHDAS